MSTYQKRVAFDLVLGLTLIRRDDHQRVVLVEQAGDGWMVRGEATGRVTRCSSQTLQSKYRLPSHKQRPS